MHLLTCRQKNSKVYRHQQYSIPLNNDRSHEGAHAPKEEKIKSIQQKKQIDKIMHGIIRERLFGNFISDEARLSIQNYAKMQQIQKSTIYSQNSRAKSLRHSIRQHRQCTPPHQKESVPFYHRTIEVNRTINFFSSRYEQKNERLKAADKLPKLNRQEIERTQKQITAATNKSISLHQKKIVINEKGLAVLFRKWVAVGPQTLIYEVKISRQVIINKFKGVIDGKLLERFFHFFGFPQIFGLRQFSGLLENAVNTNYKFIYFWVFSLLDQNANGLLTSQDLFQFGQKFDEITYIEEQIYKIARYLKYLQDNFQSKEQRQSQTPADQMLVVNHNLKLQELKEMLKQTAKEIINVNCVKNTCYHQTILSLEHDPLQRLKQSQIQNNELETKKIKNKMLEAKKKLQNTPGLRLRDFSAIYLTKRPKIFCYFVSLFTQEVPQTYQS